MALFWGYPRVLFPTPEYGLFFLAIFVLAWGLHGHVRAHQTVLLLASYAFYGFWDWRFVPLLVGLSLLAALVGQRLQREARPGVRRWLVGLGVTAALGTLVTFKYLGFLAVGLLRLLSALGVSPPPFRVPEVLLPVGVSFFVFHAISLMVDAYRGRIPVAVGVRASLLYVAFFPQLVAGPILRAESFLPQLERTPDPRAIELPRALGLVVLGLIKKVLLANVLATRLVDPFFEAPQLHAGPGAWLAVYGYAAQIYCDFSGYTDMAIGSALLLGYHFPPNFDAPYLADSPQDFWRRWHLSLSTWLRDYLFIPLGGSRKGPGRTLANLLVTMVLGGLWHGAAWTFVLWGALHGTALVLHRLWAGWAWAPLIRLRGWPGYRWVARLGTFHLVCLGWVLFRAPSLDVAGEALSALRGGGTGPGFAPSLAVVVALGLASQALPRRVTAAVRQRFERWPLVAQGAAAAMAVLIIEALAPEGIAPFIYFRF